LSHSSIKTLHKQYSLVCIFRHFDQIDLIFSAVKNLIYDQKTLGIKYIDKSVIIKLTNSYCALLGN